MTLSYFLDGVEYKGYLANPANPKKPLPAVIIAHAWKGLNGFAKKQADELAKKGYIAFAADLYGNGTTATDDEEAAKLMLPLFLDRALLRNRIQAALKTVQGLPHVDPTKIGAIGFCFGGLTVIELIKSGAPICGAVSFHGLLANSMGEDKAVTQPIAKEIKGSLLILNGAEDPMVSQEDIYQIQQELINANVDWQLNNYGQAKHAFTNPEAHDDSNGFVYNERICKRAFKAMNSFFEEKFS